MAKTRIVFLGINDAGRRIHNWLAKREDVVCLLTRKEELASIEQVKPDIIVSCGFRYKVPSDIRLLPLKGCINIHPSYLPFNRGANPNVWSIIEANPAGVSIHFMDDGIDTGAIIARRKVVIEFNDSAKDVYKKLENAQVELFTETWEKISKENVTVVSQKKTEGTFHTVKDFKELCRIDPDCQYTGRELLNRLRALTFPPYDNAYIIENKKKYYLRLGIYPSKRVE